MRQTQRAATGIQTISGSVSALCVWLGPVTTPDRESSVGASVSLFREPDAGNLPVRFDERGQETGPSQTGLRWARRKLRLTTTGRLQSLRLFSTLLRFDKSRHHEWNTSGLLMTVNHIRPRPQQQLSFPITRQRTYVRRSLD